VYTGDTEPTDAVVAASEDADLLIHDATFAEDRRDRAQATAHSTAKQAAEVAQRAGTRRLALTHVSTRYGGDSSPLAHEAADAFEGESFVARDGQKLEVPYPDEE